MNVEEKYKNAFDELESTIGRRRLDNKFTALGFTSNLDILCDFKTDKLNQLIEKYLPDAKIETIVPVPLIRNVMDFISVVVHYCSTGKGGEVDIRDTKILEGLFDVKLGMGGTATQAAMALAEIGCPTLVHLTDDSKEVCDLLRSDQIYVVDYAKNLVHTDKIMQQAEQEVHYIIQFRKGDKIKLKEQEIIIPCSNRLIVTKITVNETVPFSENYFEYIENHAKNITSNVLSSFNALQNELVLVERLNYVIKHIDKYKANNEKGIVFFEDAHYHSSSIRRKCLEKIYPYVDIVSLNEEELEYTLKMDGITIDKEDIMSCIQGIKHIISKYEIKKGVIVHTKDYSMYMGKEIGFNVEKGLMYGNILATAKALSGWYGNREQLEKVMELSLSEQGNKCLNRIKDINEDMKIILVPTRYIDKPQYTIGLGDSFVAGMQICFE